MKSLFSKIGSSIHKNPFKLLFLSVLVVVALIAGASNIEMATGNETLVQADNEVYIATKKMEATFGGDSILVLIESESDKSLLTVENMQILYDIEKQLNYEDDIFSIMSPASIVHQATAMQKEMLVENVASMSDGLATMGDSLGEIGNMLLSMDMLNPNEMLAKLNNLSELTTKFNQLSEGQDQLTLGLSFIETNLLETATGLETLSVQLNNVAKDLPQEQKMPLITISEQLKQTSLGLSSMSNNTKPMQEATDQTSNALDGISSNLEKELASIQNNLSKAVDPAQLKEMAQGFVMMGESLNSLSDGLETIVEKSPMVEASIVSTQTELNQILYRNNNTLQPMFDDVVINEQQVMMVIKLDGNLDDARKDELSTTIETLFHGVEIKDAAVIVSGKSVLDLSLKSEMQSSMMMMVALAVAIMFVVLGLIFKVKWRMLSLGVIFVSVIATLGFMGWVSVPITMVSMAVFPILIGLGIDYSIQFHNRFEEEKDIEKTAKHIGKAVFIAVIATMLGFISLFASPVPMIQDFGKMLTIGVFISFLGSLFILLPTLRAAQFVQTNGDDKKQPVKDTPNSWFHRLLAKAATLTIKARYLILIVFVLLAGYGLSVDSLIKVETNIETFMPQDLEALDDIQTIRGVIESTDQIVVYFEDENVLSEENYEYINNQTDLILDKYSSKVTGVKTIYNVVSNSNPENELTITQQLEFIDTINEDQRKMFVSEDDSEAIMMIQIKPLSTDLLDQLISDLKSEFDDSPMSVSLTGKSMLDVEMVSGLTDGRINMTLLGLGLVFLALLLLYRHLIKAILPIIPVSMIIGISSAIMYLLNIDWTPITATLGALVLGMGTEMTIMMMERYLEDRAKGMDKLEAIQQAVAKIGKAILASGLTTIGGFSVLIFSSFVILQDFGLMTMVNITLALVATFVVLPPLLYIFDSLIVKKPSKKEA